MDNDIESIKIDLSGIQGRISTDQVQHKCAKCEYEVIPRCLQTREQHQYRKAFSEVKLWDILGNDFNVDEGTAYHCMSGGNIDSLSYLKFIIRQQNLKYVLLSTWCMADDDTEQFSKWKESGAIDRLDAYVGEIFPGSYQKQHNALKKIVEPTGRVCVFRNHAKIYAGIGEKFAFAIESSANINTNPRTENTTIIIGKDIFNFYKSFFDLVNSFTKDFPDWKPWNGK